MLQMLVTNMTAGWYRPACPVQLLQPLLLYGQVQQSKHKWLDIAITNMYADQVQVNQRCMLVGTSLHNDIFTFSM